jgi:hypothetical protein
MTTEYAAVGQTPAGDFYWAAVPLLGGNAQVIALDFGGDPMGEDNPMPLDLIEETL